MQVYEIACIRTNNFTDDQVMEKFATLWQTTSQQCQDKAPLFGVYHDYASDSEAIILAVQRVKLIIKVR